MTLETETGLLYFKLTGQKTTSVCVIVCVRETEREGQREKKEGDNERERVSINGVSFKNHSREIERSESHNYIWN